MTNTLSVIKYKRYSVCSTSSPKDWNTMLTSFEISTEMQTAVKLTANLYRRACLILND